MTENFRELEWVKELEAFEAKTRERLTKASDEAGHIVYDMMPLGHVPNERILAFAKAVRSRPEIWDDCVIEGKRRSPEINDPDSDLIKEGWAKPWYDPDKYLHNRGRYGAFRDWFIIAHCDKENDDPSAYHWANEILRKWASGEWPKDDDEVALTFLRRWNSHGLKKDEGKA